MKTESSTISDYNTINGFCQYLYIEFPRGVTRQIFPALKGFCLFVNICEAEAAGLGIFGIVKSHTPKKELRNSVLGFIAFLADRRELAVATRRKAQSKTAFAPLEKDLFYKQPFKRQKAATANSPLPPPI